MATPEPPTLSSGDLFCAYLTAIGDGDEATAAKVRLIMTSGKPETFTAFSEDVQGHEHAGKGPNGGQFVKNRNGDDSDSSSGEHYRALLTRISEVPHALIAKVTSWVQGKYDKLAERYGPTGAKAILAAAVLMTPIPLPGTTLLPIALAEAVKRLHTAIKGKTMSEESDNPLSQEAIAEESQQLLGELFGEDDVETKAFAAGQPPYPGAILKEVKPGVHRWVVGKPGGTAKVEPTPKPSPIQATPVASVAPTPDLSKAQPGEKTANSAQKPANPATKAAQPTSQRVAEKGTVHQSKVAPPEQAGQQSSPEEHRAAVKKALEKFKNVPKPTKEEIEYNREGMARLGANKFRRNLVGNTNDRRKRREALLREFGTDGQTCPCIYCGVKIGEGTLEQDKIMTTAQGGRYRMPNLVPSCSACNKVRSDKPFSEVAKKLDLKNPRKTESVVDRHGSLGVVGPASIESATTEIVPDPESLATAKRWTDQANHLSPDVRERYTHTTAVALTKMTKAFREQALAALNVPHAGDKGGVRFHPDIRELTAACQKASGKHESAVGGFVVHNTGDYRGDSVQMHLDGDNGAGSKDTALAITLHELGHCADVGRRYSNDPEWQRAYKKEVTNAKAIAPQLSRYARVSAVEGFAELHRVMSEKGIADTKANFPRMMAFLESKGLLQ